MHSTGTPPGNSGHDLAGRVRELVRVVWVGQDLDRLDEFWTVDCVNHAAPPPAQRGLVALREY